MAVTRYYGTPTYLGLSSDTKPTDASVNPGSEFLETNTGDRYIYDGAAWSQVADLTASVLLTVQGTLTDRSGAITLGGTAQQAMAANASRRYLLLQNPTTGSESFWIAFTTAVVGSPSIEVAPGVTLIWEGSLIPTQAISVIAATTASKWTAREG